MFILYIMNEIKKERIKEKLKDDLWEFEIDSVERISTLNLSFGMMQGSLLTYFRENLIDLDFYIKLDKKQVRLWNEKYDAILNKNSGGKNEF